MVLPSTLMVMGVPMVQVRSSALVKACVNGDDSRSPPLMWMLFAHRAWPTVAAVERITCGWLLPVNWIGSAGIYCNSTPTPAAASQRGRVDLVICCGGDSHQCQGFAGGLRRGRQVNVSADGIDPDDDRARPVQSDSLNT